MRISTRTSSTLLRTPTANTTRATTPTAAKQPRTIARVALRPGHGHDLARNGRPATPLAGDPEGFEVYELPLTPVLVGEICALGADAIALAPDELVDDVVARLRAVAGRSA